MPSDTRRPTSTRASLACCPAIALRRGAASARSTMRCGITASTAARQTLALGPLHTSVASSPAKRGTAGAESSIVPRRVLPICGCGAAWRTRSLVRSGTTRRPTAIAGKRQPPGGAPPATAPQPLAAWRLPRRTMLDPPRSASTTRTVASSRGTGLRVPNTRGHQAPGRPPHSGCASPSTRLTRGVVLRRSTRRSPSAGPPG